MNETVNTFLLTEDKFVPEMNLGEPGFTYSVCGPSTKNKERIQKFKESGDSRYIYQNGLDKACYLHDMAYGDLSIYLAEQLLIKYYVIKRYFAKNPKFDGNKMGFASMVFDKKSTSLADKSASGSGIKNENMSNQQLLKNHTNQLLENLKNERYNHLLENLKNERYNHLL